MIETKLQPSSNSSEDLILAIKEDPLLQSRLLRAKRSLALDLDLTSLYLEEDSDNDSSINIQVENNNKSTDNQPPIPFNAEKYLLKIRQLVYIGASWDRIKPYAWPVFRSQKTAESASRLVEYAFLFGSLKDTLEVIDMLELEFGSRSYYQCMHEAVRSSLILKLWQNNFDSYIQDLIEDSLGIEKLYHLSSLLKETDKNKAFDYFTQNISPIISALDTYSISLGLNRSSLICQMARIGISIHQYKKADFILRSISPQDPYYPEAMELITKIASMSHELVAKYLQPFFKEKNPSKRLDLIEYILSVLKQGGGFKNFKEFKNKVLSTSYLKDKDEDFFIKSVTYFFINPYCLVPKSSSTDIALVKLISKYKDIYKKIPTLFHILKNMALTFSVSDKYVWKFIHNEYEFSQDKIKKYWFHIASIKLFLTSDISESYLFEAMNFLENITPDFNTPYDWESLYSAICKSIKTSSLIEDTAKKKILIILKILPYYFSCIGEKNGSTPYSLTCKDINAYLNTYNYLPEEIFDSLIQIAKKEKNNNCYLSLIKRRISLYGIEARDLKDLWYFSSLVDDRDFAWRVASCLKFMNLLPQKIEALWSLSGEGRSNYPGIIFSSRDLDLILSTFNEKDSEFLSSIVKLEDCLAQLLSCINPDIIAISYPQTKYSLTFKNICSNNTYSFIKKGTRFDLSSPSKLGSFLKDSSIHQIIFYIYSHYSLFYFVENSSYLVTSLKTLLPKLANDNILELYSKDIYSWLKNLDPVKRLSFTQFTRQINEYSLDELSRLIQSFATKVLCCVYQNHYQLLSYLRDNNYPQSVINSLIEWIVSDAYSKLRSSHQLESKTPISKSVMNIKFED